MRKTKLVVTRFTLALLALFLAYLSWELPADSGLRINFGGTNGNDYNSQQGWDDESYDWDSSDGGDSDSWDSGGDDGGSWDSGGDGGGWDSGGGDSGSW